MKLPGIKCVCGEVELVAVAPGEEESRYRDLFIVERPVPTLAWCEKCWGLMRFPKETKDA